MFLDILAGPAGPGLIWVAAPAAESRCWHRGCLRQEDLPDAKGALDGRALRGDDGSHGDSFKLQ